MGFNYSLHPLWDELLRIYGVIAKICTENKLRYFSNGGTSLGVVRHKGFIPWDDDLDLYMPRRDYEKFMEVAKRELKAPYVWQSIETDPNYRFLFGKVRLNNAEMVDEISKATGLKLSGGVYVDIFPLDGFPSGKLAYWWYCVKRGLLRRAVGGNRWWGWLFGMGKNEQTNWLQFQRFYSSFAYDECELVTTVSPYDNARTPERWIFKRDWFASTKELPFENTTIPVPVGVHEILTGQFGDYMQLPPEEKRVPSHQQL